MDKRADSELCPWGLRRFPLKFTLQIKKCTILNTKQQQYWAAVFSERELTFTFAICYRPSVCRLSVCLSVVCLSVTLVHPTQAVQVFRNISTAFGTLVLDELSIGTKIGDLE